MFANTYANTHREWELEALLNKLGNEFELAIVDRGYDKGNWFVAVRKVGDALARAGSIEDGWGTCVMR